LFYSLKFTRKSGQNTAFPLDQLILGQPPSGVQHSNYSEEPVVGYRTCQLL